MRNWLSQLWKVRLYGMRSPTIYHLKTREPQKLAPWFQYRLKGLRTGEASLVSPVWAKARELGVLMSEDRRWVPQLKQREQICSSFTLFRAGPQQIWMMLNHINEVWVFKKNFVVESVTYILLLPPLTSCSPLPSHPLPIQMLVSVRSIFTEQI